MMIQINDLSVSLNEKTILKDINVIVRQGEFFCLIGTNGSGKTTLLKTIAQLIPFKTGKIKIAGNDQSSYNYKAMARQLSYVPQDTRMDFNFNVKDIVMMGRHAYGNFFNRREVDEDIVKKAMIATNTWKFKNQSILNLSGGQRRSEEHTSELQSRFDLVCRLLLEKKNINKTTNLTRKEAKRGKVQPRKVGDSRKMRNDVSSSKRHNHRR